MEREREKNRLEINSTNKMNQILWQDIGDYLEIYVICVLENLSFLHVKSTDIEPEFYFSIRIIPFLRNTIQNFIGTLYLYPIFDRNNNKQSMLKHFHGKYNKAYTYFSLI